MCLSVGVGTPDGLLVSLVVPDQVKPQSLIDWDSAGLRTVSSLALKCDESVEANLQWIDIAHNLGIKLLIFEYLTKGKNRKSSPLVLEGLTCN